MTEEGSALKTDGVVSEIGSSDDVQVNINSDPVNRDSSSILYNFEHLCVIDCPRKKSGKTKKSQGKHGQLIILQPLKDCRKDRVQQLLIQKIRLCSTVMKHPSANNRFSDIKLSTLEELTDFLRGDEEIPANAYEELIGMFGANVFRTLPPLPFNLTNEIDPEDDEFSAILSNPAWPDLEAVYNLFLSFIESPQFQPAVCKSHLRHKFVISLLPLFESPNPRERDLLKLVLHRIYQIFLSLRPFIRKQLVHIFQTFIYETERHLGIMELLQLMSSIIDGYVLPLKEEHKLFLLKTLLPLHTPRSYSSYNTEIAYCVRQFLVKDPSLTVPVLKALLRYWPKYNSPKEMMFLLEVEEILLCDERVLNECKKVKLPLLKLLLKCASCPHGQVADSTLAIFNTKEVKSLFTPQDIIDVPKLKVLWNG